MPVNNRGKAAAQRCSEPLGERYPRPTRLHHLLDLHLCPCARRPALPLAFYIILLWVSPATVHCVCFMGLRPWEEDCQTLIYASVVCVCLGQLENGNPVGMWVFLLCILSFPSSPSSPLSPNKTLCFSVILKNKSLARVYQG